MGSTGETQNGFRASSLAGKNNFTLSLAPYKHIPSNSLFSPGVDNFHSNVHLLRPPCENCFPLPSAEKHDNFVDLLEFSNFNGVPWPILPGVKSPRRWFADFRYTLSTPLPHSYPSVREEVLSSHRVAGVVGNELADDPSMSPHMARKKVARFFLEMRATLSRAVCKICAYVLFKVFRRLMTHLLVSPQQMKRLQQAEQTGVPLVYLPLHRSHLDYLLITWSAWHFGLRLPHIASGDNLNLSGFGWLLRATGAFFIRRRVDPNDESGKDAVYRSVLHSYIEQLLKNGLNIEFFLEGTRSRFGKSLLPKHGLISNVVEAVQQGIIDDCYLVPVSYTYDQVAEGVFLNELMGVPKVRESVMGVLRGVLKGFGVSKRCGAVRMHYGQPILLSDYLASLTASLARKRPAPSLTRLPHSYSYRELVPWHHEHKEQVDNRMLIRAIGFHIVYEAQSMVSISLVSVVSSLLLCKFRQGVSLEVLSADAQWLCELIIREGGDVMGWRLNETCGRSAVEYALPFIRDSVERRDDVIEPIRTHRQLIHLAYSKNALVPMFALRSVIAIVMISRPQMRIPSEDIINDVITICNWMEFEVIFCKPCDDLRHCIATELESLADTNLCRGLLRSDRDEVAEGRGDMSTLTYEVRGDEYRPVLLFYSNFVRPFLQSLHMVCVKLAAEPSHPKESTFIRELCKESLSHASRKTFDPLLESINSDSFKHSLSMLRERGVVRKGVGPAVQVPMGAAPGKIAETVLDRLRIFC